MKRLWTPDGDAYTEYISADRFVKQRRAKCFSSIPGHAILVKNSSPKFIRMQNTTKLFNLFKQFAYGQNYAIAFTEALDYFLIPFKIYENQEQREGGFSTLTTHPKKDLLAPFFMEIGELSEGFHDPLGTLYELLVSKGQHGQFFTPEPIVEFMAMSVNIAGLEPGKTVYDPACGSGRMLVTAAKVNRNLCFYGADIDAICCKMALVNFMLQSLTGEIAHMDTLANDFYRGYNIGTILKDGYHYPFYEEFTDPMKSRIWLRPGESKSKQGFTNPFDPPKSQSTNGVQGTLF